ncbi:MAG TPA: TRAP transporter small permease subunit [Syntrophomonadaceae bacterium]|nr:TRAP transporter small permease subunit [Syntrophomonadaceae bacterium]
MLFNKPFSLITDVNEKIAFLASLLIYGVIAVVVIEVGGRYFFNHPTNWSYDLAWMFYGAIAFLGGAYGITADVHVKADVVYDLLKPRTQAIIRIACYLAFFFPFALALVYSTYGLMSHAWILGETSPYTSWNPITGPIKTVLFVGSVMLLLQGLIDFVSYFKMLKDGGDKK